MRISYFTAIIVSVMLYASKSSAIDSVPMFYNLLGDNPRYQSAANAAQQALFIQSGMSKNVDGVLSYAQNQATTIVNGFVDSNLPITSKQLYFLAGTAYLIGIKKEITTKFKSPLFKQMNQTITVGKNSQSIGFNFPF